MPPDLLARFPFLDRLSDPVRRRVLEEGRAVTLPAGAFICQEGDSCVGLALVLDGRVRVYKSSPEGRELTLYHIEPGASCILTASCVLSGWAFPAFARAETEVRAWLLPAATFQAVYAADPVWQRFVNGLLAERLVDVIALVEEVAFQRLDARLARHLLARAGDGPDPVVHATHEALADDLGSAREVVSRLLKAFEDEGLVALGRAQVRIMDDEGLRRRALP